MTVKGLDYVGTYSVSASGHTCQRWDSQSPHPHSHNNLADFPDASLADAANYCRNPDGWEQGLWCVTTSSTYWEACDGVPLCANIGGS